MIEVLKPLIRQFMPFAQQKMGFSRPPRLFLRKDDQNAANPMGKTGFYDPQEEAITLYITGRHPKDIMRSLAHELQHHTQKCNGDFESVQNMGEEGYAQADPHMRTMEIQAYQASIVFRDWEDSCKGTIYYEQLQKGDNSSMSTKDWKNGEINTLLNEKWGFTFKVDALSGKKEVAGQLNENKGTKEVEVSTDDEDTLEEYATKPKGDGDDKKKDDDALEEMGCGDHDHDHGDESDEMMSMDDQSIEALADRAMDAIQAMLTAAGGVDDMMGIEMMDDEPMEEKRRMGRKRETNPDGARPMEESKLHALVRETIKELSRGK